jgi:hypothetical protein
MSSCDLAVKIWKSLRPCGRLDSRPRSLALHHHVIKVCQECLREILPDHFRSRGGHMSSTTAAAVLPAARWPRRALAHPRPPVLKSLGIADPCLNDCRFGGSNLHQRDSRSALFEGYNGGGGDASRKAYTPSPGSVGGGYGYGGYPSNGNNGSHLGAESKGAYRAATPNSKYVPPYLLYAPW